MPKRQPKPEPITPEEVMGSPALQGFDTFLRYRSGGQQESSPEGAGNGAEEVPLAAGSPSGDMAIGEAPMGEPPDGITPTGYVAGDANYGGTGAAIAEFKPGPKIRRAVKAQDGHSTGEQAIYQALWNAASPESADTRLIRVGYGGLQSLSGLDKTNCKDNIQSLIRKLAVEVVSPFSVQRNQGNVYRVFSAGAILKRRREAGMEWVIRNKGVRFVDPPPTGE